MDQTYQGRISRRLSYLLRHNPTQFEIDLDPEGFADLDAVARSLGIPKDDICAAVAEAQKRRFEIVGNGIRALYGHSEGIDLRLPKVVPPETLYHGTAWRHARKIMEKGLEPMGRLYVHLSATEEEARAVGQRREPNPAVIVVSALKASEEGLDFYKPGDIYLIAEIPPEYLNLPE